MTTWIYDVNGKEFKGTTAWSAIIDSYNSYEPEIITDWYDCQAKAYIEEDYDADWIRSFLWDNCNYKILKVIENLGYDPDDIEFSNITLKKLYKKAEKITDKSFQDFIIKLKEDSTDKRYEEAYNRAMEDFSIFINDINTDEDCQVAEFFGAKIEKTGVIINGEEFDMSEIWLCPDCNDANYIEDMENDWIHHNDEPYDSSKYVCPLCGMEGNISDEFFKNENKHLPEEWFMSRLI